MLRFLMLIVALSFGTGVFAEEPPLQVDIRAGAGGDESPVFAEILNAVQANLSEHRIHMNEVDADPDVEIAWYAPSFVSANLRYYAVSPVQSFIEDLSPLESYYPTSTYQRGIRLESTDIDIDLAADLTTGIALYTIGLCDEATAYFEAIIAQLQTWEENYSRDMLIATLLFYQGNCAVQAGDYERAIDLLQDGITYESTGDINSVIPGSVGNLAWVYVLVGEPETAVRIMAGFVELTESIPGSGDQHLNMLFLSAQINALTGDYTTAIVHLTRLIERVPTSRLYVLRGQMYRALYEWDNALADFNTAIEGSPDYAEAYYQRGLLYYSILQTGVETRPDALADFERYLELAPEGDYAAEAARYAESIRTELEALQP